MSKTSNKIANDVKQTNDKIFDENRKYYLFQAGIHLSDVAAQNEHELKVLMIVFAMFAIYMLF